MEVFRLPDLTPFEMTTIFVSDNHLCSCMELISPYADLCFKNGHKFSLFCDFLTHF